MGLKHNGSQPSVCSLRNLNEYYPLCMVYISLYVDQIMPPRIRG